jgi:hypothetical protein
MEVVIRIIHEISIEGSHFTYSLFKDKLSVTKLFQTQETALNIQLQLFDILLTPELTPYLRKPSTTEQDIGFPAWYSDNHSPQRSFPIIWRYVQFVLYIPIDLLRGKIQL